MQRFCLLCSSAAIYLRRVRLSPIETNRVGQVTDCAINWCLENLGRPW